MGSGDILSVTVVATQPRIDGIKQLPSFITSHNFCKSETPKGHSGNNVSLLHDAWFLSWKTQKLELKHLKAHSLTYLVGKVGF